MPLRIRTPLVYNAAYAPTLALTPVGAAAATIASGAFSPPANRRVVVFADIYRNSNQTVGVPQVTSTVSTGTNPTWTKLGESRTSNNTAPDLCVACFISNDLGASPPTGLNVTVGISSGSITGCAVTCLLVRSADVTGFAAQTAAGEDLANGDPTFSFASPPGLTSIVIGHNYHGGAGTITPPFGYTELHDTLTSTSRQAESFYSNYGAKQSSNQSVSANVRAVVLAVELQSPIVSAAFAMSGSSQFSAIAGAAVGSIAYDFVADTYWHNNASYSSYASLISGGGRGTFSRSSTGTYRDAAGVVSSFATDTLRRGTNGALIEPSDTNLSLQSNFAASWTLGNVTLTPNNVTSPDNTTNAATMVENTSNTTHGVQQNIVVSSAPATFTSSGYFKPKGSRRVVLVLQSASGGVYTSFDLVGGQVGYAVVVYGTGWTAPVPATITPAANGFYFCTITGTRTSSDTTIERYFRADNATGTAALSQTYTGDGTSGLYMYGAQLEADSVASSLIPTTTGSVARSADAMAIVLPDGVHDLTIKFDDNSTQSVPGVSGTYSVPTNLNRAYVKSINSVNTTVGTTGQDLFDTGTGAAPDGWTSRWDTSGVTWSESPSGYARGAVAATDNHSLTWNALDTESADMELLCEFETSSLPNDLRRLGLLLRGSGTSTTETGYVATVVGADPIIVGIVADGDSMTAGDGTDKYSVPWVTSLAAISGKTLVANNALFGDPLENMDTNYATNIAPLFNAATANTLIILGGINDLAHNSRTDTNIKTYLQSYCGKARSTGYRIAVGTLQAIDAAGVWDSTKEGYRTAFNSWLRSNYASFADYLIDFDAISQMQTPTNTVYVGDGTHPNNNGGMLMAEQARIALGLDYVKATWKTTPLLGTATYSNGNKTWVPTSTSTGAITSARDHLVLATHIVAGKKVWAVTATWTSDFAGIGLSATSALDGGGSLQGIGFNLWSASAFNNGTIWTNNVQRGIAGPTLTSPKTFGIVMDWDNSKFWYTNDGIDFYGTTGPLTRLQVEGGTSGLVLTGLNINFLNNKPYYPAAGMAGAPDLLYSFTLVDWPWTMPSGFSQI